ncbi:MAG: hypothetical protein HYT29_00010 [Parcubacteria group bacterium]|nr:hypothetical protein [Parcubacteria group bacterium]
MLLPKLLSLAALLFIFAAPLALSAHDGFPPTPLVPCKGTADSPCDFPALMHLVKHLVDFVFFLAMPVAALAFSYAGWLYLSSSASPGNISKAHGIFWSVLIGLLWVLGAWLVIKLISDALLNPDYIRLSN